MMLETETVLDRRRLRRHVSFWRIAAVIAGIAALGALTLAGTGLDELTGKKHIARVSITGTITEDRKQLEMLDKIAEDDKTAAMIVFVNSPGGTSAGGEALFQAIRKVAEKKPVVGQFGTVAASAGYIVGLATDHIISRGNTITGSVGVIAQWPEFAGFLDKVGVKVNEVRSGELKAQPSPFHPLDEKGLAQTQDMVNDSFAWFLSLVRERRNVETATVPGLEKGRVYTGRQALELKLVDGIGGEAEAVKWLEEKRNVDKDLKIVDKKPEESSRFSLFGSSKSMAETIGAGLVAGAGDALRSSEDFVRLRLDGLVSVWQPAEN